MCQDARGFGKHVLWGTRDSQLTTHYNAPSHQCRGNQAGLHVQAPLPAWWMSRRPGWFAWIARSAALEW